MQAWLDEIEAALAVGDSAHAEALVAAAGDPARAAAGQALLRLAQGDGAGYRAWLERAVAAAPDAAPVLRLLVSARTMSGDLAAAEEAARRAVQLDDGPATWELLGAALLSQGRLDPAEQAYEAALARAPGRAATLLELAKVAARRGDMPATLDRLGRAMDAAPDEDGPFEALAQILADGGSGMGAMALAAVTDAGRHDPEVHLVLALMMLHVAVSQAQRSGDRSLAAEVERLTGLVAERARGESARVRARVAQTLLGVGDVRRARLLVEPDPAAPAAERAELSWVAGLVAAAEGDDEEALALYLDAVSAAPWPEARLDALTNALRLLNSQNDADAHARADRLLALLPDAVRAGVPALRFNEAMHLLRSGRAAEGEGLLRTLAAGSHPEIAGEAGRALAQLGRTR